MSRENTSCGHKYLTRINSTKPGTNRTTKGYQVRISIGGKDRKPLRFTKFFSDLKMGGRKSALMAALKHRNRFCKQNGLEHC